MSVVDIALYIFFAILLYNFIMYKLRNNKDRDNDE